MPYIPKDQREHIYNEEIGYMFPGKVMRSGELNYAFSVLINEYMRRFGFTGYSAMNDVLGALEGAKQEFYRRVMVPYEDEKAQVNGDVYTW